MPTYGVHAVGVVVGAAAGGVAAYAVCVGDVAMVLLLWCVGVGGVVHVVVVIACMLYGSEAGIAGCCWMV